MERFDIIVVGGGNAGYCAAHAARDAGAERVLLLEKAPEALAGGNTYFTVGAFRVAIPSLEWLRPYLDDPDDPRLDVTDLPPYRPETFEADMARTTGGLCDAALTSVLAGESANVVPWLHSKGVAWRLMFDRQAIEQQGRFAFFGDMPLGIVGGGAGLAEQHKARAARDGIDVRFESPVVGLRTSAGGAVEGVVARVAGQEHEFGAPAVVLAAGGFQADPRKRAAYLGRNWDLARVRGTAFNTGEVLEMALEAGAQPAGHWSGCHAVPWEPASDRSAGDRELTNRLTRRSYQFGITVNKWGKRFLDEGEDFRNYTYAKMGAQILEQHDAVAYQIFDARAESLLMKEEYEGPGVSRVVAGSVRELAEGLGVPPETLERTVEAFNAAVGPGAFDPGVKDGKGTVGLDPPKSNWAREIAEPPFLGFPVTCGITFTFGGLRADMRGRALGADGEPVAGLFVAGEMLGGLFFGNYPSGSGLTAGAVFGRRAGLAAAGAPA